jgi:hypothetical protein
MPKSTVGYRPPFAATLMRAEKDNAANGEMDLMAGQRFTKLNRGSGFDRWAMTRQPVVVALQRRNADRFSPPGAQAPCCCCCAYVDIQLNR